MCVTTFSLHIRGRTGEERSRELREEDRLFNNRYSSLENYDTQTQPLSIDTERVIVVRCNDLRNVSSDTGSIRGYVQEAHQGTCGGYDKGGIIPIYWTKLLSYTRRTAYII